MSKIIKGMRLNALIYTEILQIMRDPSAILIAFILPIVLLLTISNTKLYNNSETDWNLVGINLGL